MARLRFACHRHHLVSWLGCFGQCCFDNGCRYIIRNVLTKVWGFYKRDANRTVDETPRSSCLGPAYSFRLIK